MLKNPTKLLRTGVAYAVQPVPEEACTHSHL